MAHTNEFIGVITIGTCLCNILLLLHEQTRGRDAQQQQKNKRKVDRE